MGSTNNTFGTKGVREYCHFLKTVSDANRIREELIDRFETAAISPEVSPQPLNPPFGSLGTLQ